MPGETPVSLAGKNYTMKRRIIRHDLVSISEYAVRYNKSRPAIYKMIDNGELVVEHISGTDYIRLKVDTQKG